MIADLAKLAARRFIFARIANALSGALGGAGGIFANILHAGGVVGALGPGRMVPALAFANAPRMHSGGWAGLRRDEVPAILERGERVLSKREAAATGSAAAPTVNVTIMARDAELPPIAHAGRGRYRPSGLARPTGNVSLLRAIELLVDNVELRTERLGDLGPQRLDLIAEFSVIRL